MISDHVSEENIVEQMFSYANAHSRNNGSVPNKTAIVRQTRLSKIEAELAKSKQNVVKHVLQSRTLEKSKVQAMLIEQALQLRIEASLGLHNGRYSKYVSMFLSQRLSFEIDDNSIQIIETASHVSPVGIAKVMYSTHQAFDDNGFALKLDSMAMDPAIVTVDLFYKICSASSSSIITARDSRVLYERATALATKYATHRATTKSLQNDSPDETNSPDDPAEIDRLRWKFLKNLLRRRIFQIKLAIAVLQCSEYKTGMGINAMQSHTLGKGTTMGSLSLETDLHSSKSENQLMISPGRLRSKDLLSTSLERSKAKQSDIKSKISNSIMSMYGSDIVPVEAIRKNKAALKTFRKIAAEKIFVGLDKMHRHFLGTVLQLWRAAAEVVRVETMCGAFQRNLAAYRVLQVMELGCAHKLHRAMVLFKDYVNRHRTNEYHGAIQHIQRCWRGSLGRHHVKVYQRHGAATTLQALMRVHLAKKIAKNMHHQRMLRRYVRVIENKWKSHIWNRTMKKVFHLQMTMRMAKRIQRVYRGHRGRVRFALFDLARRKYRNAVIFQSLWRRYRAIMRVEIMLLDRRGRGSAIIIQAAFRAYMARVAFKALRTIHRKAKVIQYLCLRVRAYREMMRRKRIRCAIKIQRVVRGRQGRLRFALIKKKQLNEFEAYWRAVSVVAPIILGYAIRKRWGPRVKAHCAKRQAAARVMQRILKAIVLGQKARIRVKLLRAERNLHNRQDKMIVAIQRRQRGISGRAKARLQKKKVEVYREAMRRQPYYYRMKDEYYRTQNLYHRGKVVKIQCMVRCHLARLRVKRRRLDIKARLIQKLARDRLNMQAAKARVEEIKKERADRIARMVRSNMLIVMFMRRLRLAIVTKKSAQVKVIKWFLKEINIVKKVRGAKENYREMRSVKVIQTKAAVKIQAVVRGKQAKEYVERSRKRLVRQRQARRIDQRHKAAIKIQCRVRCRQARAKANKRRQIREDEERERREFEELELSLEGLHEDFMKELLVIRAQKGARSMLARNHFIKRVEEYKAERDKQLLNVKTNAARKIQALTRGVQGRVKFKKNLPALRRAQKVRSFCCECEATLAVRRCRQCKDKYCATCYEKIHAKGNRRQHGWEHIKMDARALTSAAGSRGRPGLGALGAAEETAVVARAPRKQDWEEFYDESARAKYWFNKVTGEASWTQPTY